MKQRDVHSPFAHLQISKARAELKRERIRLAAIAEKRGLEGSHLPSRVTGLGTLKRVG
jgi:hypothetical protein